MMSVRFGRRLKGAAAGLVAAAVAGGVATAAIGAGQAGETGARHAAGLRIGLVLPDLSNLFIAGIRDGAQASAKKAGITLLVKGTNDAAGQTNAMLAYVGAHVDAIGVDAIDGKAIVPAIKAANKAGIPVIAVQSNVFGGKVATFISELETVAGTYIGNAIVSYCNKSGHDPCKVGVVEGNLADQSGQQENAAMRAVVAKHPTVKIVGAQPTDYDPERALNVATNLMTANPDLDYIYAWWDPGAAAAVRAAQSKGKAGKIGISAQNGDCIALGYVLKGYMYQDSAFFPHVLGGLFIDNAQKAARKETLPKFIQAPTLSVTQDLANAWLSGSAQPPAALKADILQRLKQSKSGKCPK
jgi:ribose transport system permease protein